MVFYDLFIYSMLMLRSLLLWFNRQYSYITFLYLILSSKVIMVLD